MDFSGYLRQARKLPLGVTLRKAAGLVRRESIARARLARERLVGSYGLDCPKLNLAVRIAISAADIPADLQATLRTLSANYLQHRFDLLGSGWVSPCYGFQAGGFLGHRYAPNAPAAPDRDGKGLEVIVNRSNLPRARQIWRLIAQRDYVPIDWQLDFRSGYRWSAQQPSLRLPIPVDRGADVKVPWELGRLHHLPQLALTAILAAAGKPGFEPAAPCVAEISDQLCDFIAANPPRFGVNWMCPMDIGIRAGNIALTLALLAGASLSLPPHVEEIVANSLNDHAAHVAEHLEYSESERSNHYLANLGGLVWSNWLLAGEESERRLIFAIAELLKEADNQFLPDGGNYEGSTNYHRLSGEIVLFALAVILSLDDAALARLERAKPPRRAWRAGFPHLPLKRFSGAKGGASIVPPPVLQKLAGAARLARAVQGTDGTIAQIGDTDSGRFFHLHPTALPESYGGATGEFVENTLDHGGFADAVDAIFGAAAPSRKMDAILVQRLIPTAAAIEAPQVMDTLADFGDLDAQIARWQAMPEASRRVRRLSLGETVAAGQWSREALPDFGLYLFRHDDLLISFRCAGAAPANAPRGHRHDDNLSVEYRLKSVEHRDPGSFVYTPSIEQRNLYRSAAAHDAPRIRNQSLTEFAGLFDLEEAGHARCAAWRPDGVAGEVTSPAGTVLRVLRLSSHELAIYDCVQPPAELADLSAPVALSKGYGRR